MQTKFIEGTNGPNNWGKFMVGKFTSEEWQRQSSICATPTIVRHTNLTLSLLRMIGWAEDHLWVLDLQTGEGAFFRHGGNASADLNKHKIWVCPLFEPFLTWLYEQDVTDLDSLPAHIDLPNAPFEWAGYRRPGK